MKILGLVMMGLLLVYAFFGLQDVRADEADEAYKTGLKYYNGEGVSQNYAEAIQWYWKAADLGNAKAQLNIGLMYANGKGVAQNLTEALRWFRKAADQGNADAELNIRSMNANGEGVTQNYRETVKRNYNPSVPVGQNLRKKAVACPRGF